MRILFPAVYRNRWVTPIFSLVGNRPHVVAAAFFFLYWLIPLAAGCLPVMCGNCEATYLDCIVERTLLYASDFIHLAFAIIASGVVFFAYIFVFDFHLRISRLSMARVKSSRKAAILHEYQKATGAPFSVAAIAVCVVIAAATALMFLSRIFNPEYTHWWGNYSNGIGGLVYASIAATSIFFAVKYLILLVSVSIFLVRYARKYMRILPYDPDGMSGLSSSGVVFVSIWRQSALIAGCLYMVFSTNYLDILEHWVTWTLAFFVTSILPFAAIVPLLFFASVAKRQKKLYRSAVLRSLRPESRGSFDPDAAIKFSEVAEAIDKLVVLPIQGWRFIAIALVNFVQLYASAEEIWRGLPM